MKKRLAVLISGSGTNMQSVIDACHAGKINAGVVLVISSNHEAGGLARAAAHDIESFVCALKDFPSAADRDERILQLLKAFNVDFVVLAGYLGIVTETIINSFNNRIINIHPALLPKFGGKNFYGLNVHKAVLAAGETESGATVHFVDSGTDTGQIIRQRKVEVKKDDTPESLQQRVLKIEHPLLVEVLADLCKD